MEFAYCDSKREFQQVHFKLVFTKPIRLYSYMVGGRLVIKTWWSNGPLSVLQYFFANIITNNFWRSFPTKNNSNLDNKMG